MIVGITGASGYVGGILLQSARTAGLNAIAMSRRQTESPWIPYHLGMDPAKLPLEELDVLIHTAYDFHIRSSGEIQRVNVESGLRLLRSASKRGVKKIILISSVSSYEGCRSLYGQAKYSLEQETIRLGGIVVRPGLVWGDDPGGVMGKLVELVRRFPLVPLLVGKPHPHQYLVHEEDLGRCVVFLCKSESARQRYSAAHPLPLSLKEILSVIAARDHLRRAYFPLPWRFAHCLLLMAEAAGVPLAFRSDSLIGLVFSAPFLQDESPPDGISYRKFE